MKEAIHPHYRAVLFHDTNAATDRSYMHSEGISYISLNVSSASPPTYTGQQRQSKSAGRSTGFTSNTR